MEMQLRQQPISWDKNDENDAINNGNAWREQSYSDYISPQGPHKSVGFVSEADAST